KALTAIHSSGYSMKRPKAMSPAWRSTLFRRRLPLMDAGRCTRSCAGVSDGAGATVCCAISVSVEHPELRQREVHGGDHGDHEQQHPGQRRGVAHVEVHEGVLVDVQGVEERRV